MAKIPTVSDGDAKVSMYHEVLKYLLEDSASCYLQDPANIVAVSSKLSGYNVYPMYVQDLSEVKFN